MQTKDGQTIKLDLSTMGDNAESALKTIAWAPALFYILLIGAPLAMLMDKLDVAWGVYAAMAASLAASVAGFVYLNKMTSPPSPYLPHRGAQACVHFRLMMLSTLLCFVYAEVAVVYLAATVILWAYFEFRHATAVAQITDEQLCEAYPTRFKQLETGELVYDSRAKIEGLATEPWHATKIAEIILIPLVIVAGGFLYIRSFTLRDNFEPRFLIAGCIALFIAFAVRSFMTRVALDIRALNLKAEGRF